MASKSLVKHYESCNPSYPEKVKGEAPGLLTRVDLDDDEFILQCVDCGATSRVFKEEGAIRYEDS